MTFDSGGVPVRMVGTLQDITERVLSELELRDAKEKLEDRVKKRTKELEEINRHLVESEERFSKVFQEGPLGMAIVDTQFKFSKSNKIFRNMLGYDEEELSKMTFMDITHEKDKTKDKNSIDRLFKGEIPNYKTEKRYVRKNGEILWANLTASAIFSEENVFLYAVAMIEDIGDRKLAEKKIKSSLKEKEVLLKEIHHRVKNNLQVISSLLNLQANSIDDEDTIKQLMDSKNRIMSMSMIHENIYQSENLSDVNIPEYLKMLAENLMQSYVVDRDKILLETKIEEISLDINRAIPLGLIITELLTNSIQHAFGTAEKGMINLELHAKQKNIELIIRDNGIGIPKEYSEGKNESLGLKLVYTLITQLQANLKINRKNGTEYKISFKL